MKFLEPGVEGGQPEPGLPARCPGPLHLRYVLAELFRVLEQVPGQVIVPLDQLYTLYTQIQIARS